MTSPAPYEVPAGQLCLSGPVERPVPEALPIRGDLAHIALARRYLVAHYVVPQMRRIGAGGAELLRQPQDSAVPIARLESGDTLEALDYAGEWCWGCCGPEGPTGYVRTAILVE